MVLLNLYKTQVLDQIRTSIPLGLHGAPGQGNKLLFMDQSFAGILKTRPLKKASIGRYGFATR
jgi:hypothetical protein